MQTTTLVDRLRSDATTRELMAAVQRRPNDAQANFNVARHLTETGEKAQALPYAEKACKLAPQNFHYLYYCGALYSDFKQPEFAIGMLRASVQIEPRVFLSQHDLAACYERLGHGDKAVAHYKAALKLAANAEERSKARAGLADCLVNSGETEQAQRLYESLIKDGQPDLTVHAHCRLSELRRDKPGGATETKLLAFLESYELGEEIKEELLLALGNLNDKAGNHDTAFAYWRQAREVAKAIAQKQERNELRDHQADIVFRTGFYTPAFIRDVAPHGHKSEAPVFIAGMPRSGTTLTEQILGSHPAAAAVGEISRWGLIEEGFHRDYPDASAHERLLKNAAKGELVARAEEHLLIMRTIAGRDSGRFIEKTTHSFVWLGYLATCFPKARFLHLIRHPADTFISTYQNNFNQAFPFAFDQVEFAKEYAFSIRMMNLWKALYPGLIDTYYYENLTERTEEEARRMVEFIGLPWDDGCLRFHEKKALVRTFSAQQVKKPIYRTSVDKWRVYEKHLGPLFEELERQGVTYEVGKVAVG